MKTSLPNGGARMGWGPVLQTMDPKLPGAPWMRLLGGRLLQVKEGQRESMWMDRKKLPLPLAGVRVVAEGSFCRG